jgi:glyoxylase-like metal-dependent hydrolase (beta-lactamase superfamily II)
MPLEDEFGDIVAKARIGNGLSATRLADLARVPEREIAEIESYRITPDIDTIKRLASALGLDADKLAATADGSWAPPPVDSSNESMIVRAVHVGYGSYGENAYLVGCRTTGRGAVVDPGGAVDDIERQLRANGVAAEMILITHAHADHTAGLQELSRRHPGVTVVCSALDRAAVMHSVSADWRPAEDGSSIALGKLSVTPLATPGHTQGSTCYAINGACFVGDTLFAGSIGRPTCDYERMLSAVRSKVLSLPEYTVLLPGHGPATTVREEIGHNPFF